MLGRLERGRIKEKRYVHSEEGVYGISLKDGGRPRHRMIDLLDVSVIYTGEFARRMRLTCPMQKQTGIVAFVL